MKANEAPERIWIDPATDLPKLSGHIDKNSVEYIRKDVFIEKAVEWLKSHSENDYVEYQKKNKGMKANAPDRLYLSKNIYSTYLYQVPDPDDETAVEYTRSDAFIEKAEKYLKTNLLMMFTL